MANPGARHPGNAPGAWFVDTTCIDCDVARQFDHGLFIWRDGQSVVARQPTTPEEERQAWLAALACPIGSIGREGASGGRPPAGLYPLPLGDAVDYCGYASSRSFGANSYWVRRPAPLGNLLIDSPRHVRKLVEAFRQGGGLAHILLTHRDDVADAERYAAEFGARVWIHEADRGAAPYATDLLRGQEPVGIGPGLLAIPLPGHTRGSVAYLLDGRHLFSGDSLYYSRTRDDLSAFRQACWHSWDAQADSLERLAVHSFDALYPGHGSRCQYPPAEMRERLLALVARMRARRGRAERAW